MYLKLLKHKSFMAFWGTTTFFRLASNILQFALAIYVLDMTGSAFIYSTVLAIIIIPRIILSSVAGYIADRKECLQILKWSVLGLFVLMACFWIIHVFLMPLNILLIYVLVVCLELFETLIAPSEGKALMCIVCENELAAASKISSLDDGIVEILSPAVGSLFYGLLGLTSVLMITMTLEGISFLLTFMIHVKSGYISYEEENKEKNVFSLTQTISAYKEAALYLKNENSIVYLLFFAPIFNFFVNPLFSVTTSHYIRISMAASMERYAMFNSALGIASLVAPFIAMVLIQDEDEKKANMISSLFCAVILFMLTCFLHFKSSQISPSNLLYSVTIIMMILVVEVTTMSIATSITLKKRIPEYIMGRILSIIQLCATISVPIGQLFYGICADCFPITFSFLISSCGLVFSFIIMKKFYKKSIKNKK